MGQSLKGVLESEIGCDIAFKVGDETFKAHKLVLAARSPVFRAQFFGLVGDRDINETVVEDIEPSIFKAMLLFIYADTLPKVSDIMDSPSLCTSTIMIQHLLAAADRYDLERLKLLCESKLIDEINPDTVATTLALAEQYRCEQLKMACLEFVATPENLGEVMQSEGFKHLEESCPSLLSELLKTVAAGQGSSVPVSSKKRSGSSVFANDPLHNRAATESVNEGRRVRRRV